MTTKPHYLLKALTPDEWEYVCIKRGCQLTGYSHHTADFGYAAEYKGLHYFWPMGEQPSEPILALISHKDVTRAAVAFTAFFEPQPYERGAYTYVQPKRRRMSARSVAQTLLALENI